MILNCTVRLSRPTAFNDPFDCRIPIDFEGSTEDWRRFLTERLVEGHPELSSAQVADEVERMLRGGRAQAMYRERFIYKAAEKELENMEVLCLCEPRDDLLMWSHYANGHRGVCFGFRTIDWVLLRKHAKPVQYVDRYPMVNFFRTELREAAHQVTFTKSLRWSHEREWRVVRKATRSQMYAYDPEALQEVILGCEIGGEERRQIVDAVRRAKSTPKVLQAYVARGKFALRFEEIDVNQFVRA